MLRQIWAASLALINYWKHHFPALWEIFDEFLAVEALFVGSQLKMIERQVDGHKPPGATAHAQHHADWHVDHDLSQVVWTWHVQTVEPAAAWQLVRRRYYVSCTEEKRQ